MKDKYKIINEYFKNKKVKKEMHLKNGNFHRTDGPAYIQYYSDGSKKCESYWLNGIEYEDIFKWLVAVGNIKLEV